jgi:hypothetical protein
MLARIRIALGLLLFLDAARRWPYAVELYSSAGLPLPLWPNTVLVPPTPNAFWAVVLDTLQLFALAAAACGWWTRFSLLASAVLMTWMGLLDFPGTFAKYSVIAIHLLVLLAVSGSHRAWSIDAWVGRWNRGQCRLTPLWPQRLMGIMLCAVYFGAGVTKVRMPEFASGDLLLYSLLDSVWGAGELGSWLASHPHLLALASLGVMLFELVAPFLIWVPALRKPVWGLAVLMHVGMAVLMYISIFSPVMLIGLMAFLQESDLPRWLSADRASASPGDTQPIAGRAWVRPLASGIAYVSLAVVCCGVGYAVQVQQDLYGVFHNRPVEKLPEVSADDVAEMLGGQQPREEDYLHRIDLGTRYTGSQVFGSSKRIRRGQTVYVLTQFTIPHPKLMLEGLLLAPDGHEVARFTHEVEPKFSYAMKGFQMVCDKTAEGDAADPQKCLPAGRYRIILQANGYEVAQKSFELVD